MRSRRANISSTRGTAEGSASVRTEKQATGASLVVGSTDVMRASLLGRIWLFNCRQAPYDQGKAGGTPPGTRPLLDTLATIFEILVYVAMAAVVIVLVMGLTSMSGGTKGKEGVARSNRLMRWRVGIQLLAIALLAILVFVVEKG